MDYDGHNNDVHSSRDATDVPLPPDGQEPVRTYHAAGRSEHQYLRFDLPPAVMLLLVRYTVFCIVDQSMTSLVT
jgi:hypothetical protein